MVSDRAFVVGLDLDGTCADFYARMREIAAEWLGVDPASLTRAPDWDLRSWGVGADRYEALHRFAVSERSLFSTMAPLPGAPEAIRNLSDRGLRIRIITHRLVIGHTHLAAVSQTVAWLEREHIPYWDLCFMGDKGEVGADLYVEDSPAQITALRALGKDVLVMSSSVNAMVRAAPGERAADWSQAEAIILERHRRWQIARTQGRDDHEEAHTP